MADSSLEWPDLIVIALYFVIVIGVGVGVSLRAKTDNSLGYFLAGRSTTWIPLGASTYATNIGAQMFVGLAGSAAASGIAVVMFEWHAMFMLILLGWVFLPVYTASGCFTTPQFMKMRFGGQRVRLWVVVISIFLHILSSISGQIYSGAVFITQIFNWNLYGSIIFILAVTAVYTVIGGLTAVIWTDTIQTVILVIGSFILAALSLSEVGGFEQMRTQYMASAANYTYRDVALYGNRTCGMPRDDAFHIFRAPDADYPWPGMVFGLTILGLNAWCFDQLCVQRSLSAKNLSHAKAGITLAAYLKVLPFLFFIIPGMISRILFPQEIACADPELCSSICENPSGCSNIAYPLLVLNVMPVGIRGIMFAALLSALMSSLTSIFNSSSTLFTLDIWKRFRKHAKESELMIVGRMWTLFLVVVALLWLPILLRIQGSQFWNYTQSVSSFILPPVVMTYLMGMFWTRTTEQGAFCGLVIGFLVGLVRMGLEWSIPAPECGSGEENKQFKVVTKVNYLHFAIITGVIVVLVEVVVSLMTPPRKPEQLRRLTFWTKDDPEFPELTEESEVESEDEKEPESDKTDAQDNHGFKYIFCKYICGVDKTYKKPKLSREQLRAIQEKMTSTKENPTVRRILNVNVIICTSAAVFLHAFWA